MTATATHQTDPSRYGDLTVVPVSDALGAEIKGVDLSDVDEATYRAIRKAWVDNLVVLIRNKTIGDEELVAFSRLSGNAASRRSLDCLRLWSFPTSKRAAFQSAALVTAKRSGTPT